MEDITFILNKNNFYVSGDYYFRNNSNQEIKQQIYYPIYTDSVINSFDSASVFCYNTNQKTEFRRVNDGIIFHINIPPKDSAQYKISYKQSLAGSYARYILTTTKSWGKPLQTANYYLISDKKIHVDFFSYNPIKTSDFGEKIIYQWSFAGFMPTKDFEIKFSIK